MLNGHAQIFMWGWNADYPDPENFFFLLYGANSKVLHGGENAVNYQNSDFDRLFKQMSNMENSPQRLAIVREMQEIIRHDAPWVYGFHPKSFSLFHNWYHNLKPNLMANNKLKYQRIEPQLREESRQQWNQPVLWPVIGIIVFLVLLILPAIRSFQRRARETIK
jgi:ABC-type oligopeptide transport system substrate-binding subunit